MDRCRGTGTGRGVLHLLRVAAGRRGGGTAGARRL